MARTLDDALDEWLHFVVSPRSLTETTEWCTIKAMEICWDFYDLTDVLFEIKHPTFSDSDEPDKPRQN